MRAATRERLEGLMALHQLNSAEQREAAWRQGMATLARAVIDERRPLPLEGLDPDILLESLRVAVEGGLVDRLDWLSGPAAAAALYELAAALPPSSIKRQLGRMVLKRLRSGDAATFVSVATQLALGSQRALGGPSIRARVALALSLPIGSVHNVDALALALISRQDTSRDWLLTPATGSLPSRRLAARLLERAAREAARRATEGDDAGVRVFCTPEVRDAWDRLLADRETLVWRHVASARGLLAASMPTFKQEIQRHLDPDFTITEWRRAAASLAASIAIEPEEGLRACRELLESLVFEQDHGIAAAMIAGLPRAAESHPLVVESLLEQLMRVGGLETAEALVGLRAERIRPKFAEKAATKAEAHLRKTIADGGSEDLGREALMKALADELSSASSLGEPTLRERLSDALQTFATHGAYEAAREAKPILEAAARKAELLQGATLGEAETEVLAFLALRELNSALFETSSLNDLLLVGEDDEQSGPSDERLGDLFQQVTNWLVIREGDPLEEPSQVNQFTMRLRQLQAMLHLVDADGPDVDPRKELVRQRRLLTQRVLLNRIQHDAPGSLRRTLCAAAARTCDALVREDGADVSEILIAAAQHVSQIDDLKTMSEASMVPEIESALRAYAKLQQATRSAQRGNHGLVAATDAMKAIGIELPVARAARIEAFRQALSTLARGLRAVAASNSLFEVAERSPGTPLATLERGVAGLAQLVSGSRRRLGESVDGDSPSAAAAIWAMGLEVERAVRTSISEMDHAFTVAVNAIDRDLPGAFAELTGAVLHHLRSVPLEGPRRAPSLIPIELDADAPLPAWAPPSRIVGGFYLVRTVGMGTVGSVFVARRAEDRQDETAAIFALKVPDYSAAAARTLSEDEFLKMFRDEAGALLALPEHPNIARFVTFDAGASPKPILVMELVEGPSLERMLEMGDLSLGRARELLLGVSAGLDAMHQVGVGHLDLKPSNIIVCNADAVTGVGQPPKPVLVDFGLAGRHLRPGCGTANYGAPEIWGAGNRAGAIPADVYAFGCLTFEAYTGKPLFDGLNEAELLGEHLAHDGDPEAVRALLDQPETRRLGALIACCLRRDPKDRITMRQARQFLAELNLGSENVDWPVEIAS
ncbi:MAG: serine/threonine protein kinase [Deltaproteobacteria bacterium]|nr:serine/threonine protein kinase [Deltaproteobacteria bacterium]NND30342.1 serine/threonine protein kinase [Myxococcales bacterium]MBT8465922.1 serine/threonine protein kinase [Deltaproteobacteria bacterium]MBT8483226.1 serine/threonine protein kinase [Deltaproteobacteria bacterium]NNK06212.1 serine/threonine protein kinase [Myxococcales bacterium]